MVVITRPQNFSSCTLSTARICYLSQVVTFWGLVKLHQKTKKPVFHEQLNQCTASLATSNLPIRANPLSEILSPASCVTFTDVIYVSHSMLKTFWLSNLVPVMPVYLFTLQPVCYYSSLSANTLVSLLPLHPTYWYSSLPSDILFHLVMMQPVF